MSIDQQAEKRGETREKMKRLAVMIGMLIVGAVSGHQYAQQPGTASNGCVTVELKGPFLLKLDGRIPIDLRVEEKTVVTK